MRSSQKMLLLDFAVRCVIVWCQEEKAGQPLESLWGGSLVGGIPEGLRLEGFLSACLPCRRRVSEPTAFWAVGHLFPL